MEYVEQAVADAHVNPKLTTVTNMVLFAGDMTPPPSSTATAAPTSHHRPARAGMHPTWWSASSGAARPPARSHSCNPHPSPRFELLGMPRIV
jgi:23S rRNA (uracil1939-C5)-methyltransferase